MFLFPADDGEEEMEEDEPDTPIGQFTHNELIKPWQLTCRLDLQSTFLDIIHQVLTGSNDVH